MSVYYSKVVIYDYILYINLPTISIDIKTVPIIDIIFYQSHRL
jgi:hypothetical protein